MKKHAFLLLLIFIPFIFTLPLFFSGFYDSHDGEAHVARFAAYFKAFADGQIPPRWAADLNYRYGTPVFIFYYPLPGYTASLLHGIGLSFESAYKILISGAFILSGISFYLWATVRFRKPAAFIGGILYGLSPYHFLNLYVRGDVAELISLAFVPLVFFAIDRIGKKKDIIYTLTGGIFYALVILSHNGISLLFSGVFLLYILTRIRSRRDAFFLFPILVIGLMLSVYFWLPALYESKYTTARIFIADMYREHFPALHGLFYSVWGNGPDINKPGGLSAEIGIGLWLTVIAGIFMYIKGKKKNTELLFWLAVFFSAVFFSLSVSGGIWNYLQLLKLLQFPWRIGAVSGFAASVIACFVFAKIRNFVIPAVLLIALFLFSVRYTVIRPKQPMPDSYYLSYTQTTFYHGEATTIWTAGDPAKIPGKRAEVIEGTGRVKYGFRNSLQHEYTVYAEHPVKIVDNTLYFPGWKVLVDSIAVPVEFQDPNYRGLITFSVPSGKHTVTVQFTETLIRQFADILTVVSGAAIFLLWLKRNAVNKFSQNI